MPARHPAQDVIEKAVSTAGAAGVVEALAAAGFHVVPTDEVVDRMEQAERAHDRAEARFPTHGGNGPWAQDPVGAAVMAGRIEVHELYEPMVQGAKATCRDLATSPDCRALAARLLDLIGSRS